MWEGVPLCHLVLDEVEIRIFALLLFHHLLGLTGAYQMAFYEPVELFLFLDSLPTSFIVI